MIERLFELSSDESEVVTKLVESLSAYYGGTAMVTPGILVQTENTQVMETLELIMGNDKPHPHSGHELPERKERALPKSSQGEIFREGGKEKKRGRPRKVVEAGEFGLAFCRNCFEKFARPHLGSKFCTPGCNNRYHSRGAHILETKGRNIDELFAYRTNHKVLYFTEEEFRAKLKDGGFEEGEKILSPLGYLLVVRMQGGEYVTDEVRASSPTLPSPNGQSSAHLGRDAFGGRGEEELDV